MDGPYRATKLWNEMLHTFKHGMPLRKHRRHMRVYDNCFSGAEAIQWLQIALKDNPNIKPGITKTQVRQLLSKFMKAGIFCSVSSSNSMSSQEFKESEIYQFLSSTLNSVLLPSNECAQVPASNFESNVHKTRKVINIDKKEIIMQPNSITSLHPDSGIPFESCQENNFSDVKLGRNASFHFHEPRNVKQSEKNVEKENIIFSSHCQPYLQKSPVPVPPKKPLRRLESFASTTNNCNISNDAKQNLNAENKNPQHEVPRYSQNSIGSCSHFDRHAHAKSYPSSTHRSPPYESADHMVYKDKLPRKERSFESSKTPYEIIDNGTKSVRNTKAEKYSENYLNYPPPPYIRNAKCMQQMEYRPNFPAGLLKPLHSNILLKQDTRGNSGTISSSSYRRDCGGRLVSDINSQFSGSENLPYDSIEVEEKNFKNWYWKTTDVPCVSNVPPTCVNQPTCSESEIRNTWKMTFIWRLETVLLGMDEITSLLPDNLRTDWLIRNVQDQGDVLPRSASVESRLDEWPEDIINNYIEQLSGVKDQLIPSDLYNLIIKTYLYIEHINNASVQFSSKLRGSILASRSVESLVLGMASPCAHEVKPSKYSSKQQSVAGSSVYCYETAFASDTPITRIVPQNTLKDVYFPCQSTRSRSFRSSHEKHSSEDLKYYNTYENPSYSSLTHSHPSKTMLRSKSSQDIKEIVTDGITDKPLKDKSQSRVGRRPWRITKKLVETSRKTSGIQHCRNKSGGYVNPALSQSLEELSSQKLASQDTDYIVTLQSLESLLRQTQMSVNDKRNDKAALQEGTSDLSSESGSYYTAASTPEHQKYSITSLNKEHEQIKWKQPALGLGISVFQLILLLISPSSRCLLKRLLRCLHHLPTAINTEEAMQVLQSMTPNVLAHDKEDDKSLPFRVVRFLVTFYKDVFEIPADFQSAVRQHLNKRIQAQKVTYCEQVTSKQFEEQGLSASQKALSELLEQILSDSRMGDREKKRRLKMFKERYPTIYKQHFPDFDEDLANSEKVRGILQLPSFSKLKNIRI